MQGATVPPYYLADWAATLASVQPGFCIVSDMQVVNRANPGLRQKFRAVE